MGHRNLHGHGRILAPPPPPPQQLPPLQSPQLSPSPRLPAPLEPAPKKMRTLSPPKAPLPLPQRPDLKQCYICGKRFNKLEHLQRHLATHKATKATFRSDKFMFAFVCYFSDNIIATSIFHLLVPGAFTAPAMLRFPGWTARSGTQDPACLRQAHNVDIACVCTWLVQKL